MNGPLDLGGNEIYGLALIPVLDNAATSKKYVEDLLLTHLSIFGGTMSGQLSMGNQRITYLSDPQDDHNAATKGYVTGLISGLALGLSQADADARYVRKTKLTLADFSWGYADLRSAWTYPKSGISGWPHVVRNDRFTRDTNIEIRTMCFDKEIYDTDLKTRTIHFRIHSIQSDHTLDAYDLTSIKLSTKFFQKMYEGTSSNAIYCFHIDEEIYVGADTKLHNSALFQIGIRATGGNLGGSEVFVNYGINEEGQNG